MSDLGSAGVATEGAQQVPSPVLVRLCSDLETLHDGLDLNEIADWFFVSDPEVDIERVAGLCQTAGVSRASSIGRRHRLVLGLCGDARVSATDEAQLREAGLDPLGVGRVNLGGYCAAAHPPASATDKAKILLAAAVTRVRAFDGSSPGQVKPRLGS